VGPEDQLVENRLGEQLGVSRNSVRAALQILAEEGLVVRRTKTGTRTSQGIVEIPVGEALPQALADGDELPAITIRHLAHQIARPPDRVRIPLGMPERPLLVVEHLALWHGEPLYLRTGYIPMHEPSEDILARLSEADDDPSSAEHIVRNLFGAGPHTRRAAVEAVPATDETARLLGLPPGRPVLLRQLVMEDEHGAVREVSFTHFRGDRVALATGGP